jgi:hypothetical protein
VSSPYLRLDLHNCDEMADAEQRYSDVKVANRTLLKGLGDELTRPFRDARR